MCSQFKMEHSAIENLLSWLHDLKDNNVDIESEDFLQSHSPLEIQSIQTAYQLKAFMDKMPGGFFIYHADGDEELIYANKAMLRIFNCDTMKEFRTLTGNSFRGIVHPEDLEDVEQSIRKQIAASQYDLDYVTYRIIQKNGEIRWVDDYGHFIHSETAGDIFYVFVGDITQKKIIELQEKEKLLKENYQKEQQLQEYDQELRLIHQEHLRRLEMIEGLSIDYASIFYADFDLNQITAYRISSRFEEMFFKGRHTCEFWGFDKQYIEKWVHPDDRTLVSSVFKREFICERLAVDKSFHINYRVINNNGNTQYIQLRIVKVGNQNPASQIIIGYRNIDDEIIQEMKQKQILSEALEEANRANNTKNLFLSNMSHDIRTPMNAIVGFISLAKKHIDNMDKVSNYLDSVSTASDQLLQLLNNVLEISRIESGKIHPEETDCSLTDIAHQAQMEMLSRAEAKNITLSLDIARLKHDNVYVDPHKLTQILTYLVDNAVKYTKTGGRVMIAVIEQESLSDERAAYQFVVEDNGIGISKEFLQHIFEPFEREKNTTLNGGIYGTGLGLTIAKELVEMIGGTIDIVSVIDEGSKFIVTLPLRLSDQSLLYSFHNDDTPMQLSRPRRILIVDDNEINREIEYEVLRDVGFLVETADDGSAAVEKVKKSQPGYYDLILMDIQMPVMNGYCATKAIRNIENPALAGIPIIAVSANTFEEDKKKAIESGMNAHLAKPLDTLRLYKLIGKFLREERLS